MGQLLLWIGINIFLYNTFYMIKLYNPTDFIEWASNNKKILIAKY